VASTRENLAEGSLGMEMYLAADRGQLTQAEATLMVGILLSAAADTTVMTMANAIRAFCEFPDQYQLLRSDPTLLKAAFDESLRWDSPSRMAGRIAMHEPLGVFGEMRRFSVKGPQDALAGYSFAGARHVRRERDNQVYVIDAAHADDFRASLPAAVTATPATHDLETIVSEWMR
jgi:hypothetical protein